MAPSPAALGAKLTWTKVDLDQRSPRVAWLGDRFVLADQDSGAVYTSTDGIGWQGLQPGDDAQGYVDLLRGSFASWQDSAVGWWNPGRRGRTSPAQPPITARDIFRSSVLPLRPLRRRPSRAGSSRSASGPTGVVAEVHSDLDWDAWVTRSWVPEQTTRGSTHLKSVDYRDGILQIKLDNGPGLKVVWADEGLAPGDYQDKGFGVVQPRWRAVDGDPPVRPPLSGDDPTFPMGGFGGVVGVSDGFIAQGRCG